jgi:hypothetical protein
MAPAPAAKKPRPPSGGRRSRDRSRIRLDRLRTGDAISLVAAVLLFVLMFLDWYGTKVGHEGGGGSLEAVTLSVKGGNAWQTLEVIPIFLMLAIAVAVGAALLRLSGSDWKPSIPPGAAVCGLGGLAALLILIRIVAPPGLGGEVEGISFDTNLEVGIFLAFAAALGIAYGGWRTMRDEGTSFAAVGESLESGKRPAKPKSSSGSKPGARTKS